MPAKNVSKLYAPDSYYHLYNRGVDKRKIFLDESDYKFFLSLFDRYFSFPPSKDGHGRCYPNFLGEVEIIAFCLMPTHFHLLLYQHGERSVTQFSRALMTAYSMYFNDRQRRSGRLFENQVKGALINEDAYLWHISRYIHRNPEDLPNIDYRSYPYSSYRAYAGGKIGFEWLQPGRLLDLFRYEHVDYASFTEQA